MSNVMMAMLKSPVIAVTLHHSRFTPSSQARFLLQIREHAITWTIVCYQVKLDDAAQCPGNSLPPAQGQAHALMLEQGFTCPLQPHKQVAAVVELARRHAPSDI
jgi:hypothetical protein